MAGPTGTVTFLFTDIEGSTRLWESAPDAMRSALERHDQILRSAIGSHEGFVFATGGDGFAVAFSRVGDALSAVAAAQSALLTEQWPEDATVRVRMGVHTGEAEERGGDYFGPVVNRAARLVAAAHGDQAICSGATAVLAGDTAPLRSLGKHRLRDLSAAEEVFQIGDGAFPPLRSVDVVPTNLPTIRTDLLGRDDDIAALVGVLESERLLTLTGVGGVGKTRLALGVAAAIATNYSDGCWFVDLAPSADDPDVALAIAVAIGAPVTGAADLGLYLAERQMLLVLDNCEHVVAAVADQVDSVLSRTSDIQIVATSREPLGVDGEIVRRVGSLGVPPEVCSPNEALATPAVHLFAERATSASEQFTVDEENVGPIIEICQRLDGIPLAIELAAARVRAMPAAEIARRIDERFRWLGGGSRRAHERHRTLLAAVSWSHDLLSTSQQQVFRRLAVFPSSFTLDAAQSVASYDEMSLDVAACVLDLVDRSLVQFDLEQGRYRLLETIRQYGADRLAEARETDVAAERHARFFLDLVQSQAESLVDARYLSARSTLSPELDNLRATSAWLAERARWVELADLCEQSMFLAIQVAPVEGASWRRQVIDHASDIDPQMLVDVLGELSYLQAENLADFAAADEAARQSTELAHQLGLRHSSWAWAGRAHACIFTGRFDDGLDCAKRALELADTHGDEGVAAVALAQIAASLSHLDQQEASESAAAELLRRAHDNHHPLHIGAALIVASSNLLSQRPGPDCAGALEVLASEPEVLDVGGTNEMWLELFWGWALTGLGRAESVHHLGRALRMADQSSAHHVSDVTMRLLAIAFAQNGHSQEASALVDYVDANLSPYRIQQPGNDWIDEQLRSAGLAAQSPAHPSRRRGEIMVLISTTEQSITEASP